MSYINYNANPKGLRTGDCVIRALSKATGKSWDEVYTELCEIGYKKKKLPNNDCVYKAFLKENHFYLHPAIRDEYGKLVSVDYFSKIKNSGIYIVHTRNHLTIVSDGDIYDTWNTSRQTAGKYYSEDL